MKTSSIKSVIILFCCVLSTLLYAQDPSSILDLESTTQGVLIPRMTTTERMAISSPAQGLLVYDTQTSTFWRFDVSWSEIGGGSTGVPNEISDADGDTKVKTETNPDEDKVRIDIGGQEKMILARSPGGTILFEHKNNNDDVAFGAGAGDNLLADGVGNTLIGTDAGNDLTTGDDNTFIGFVAGENASTAINSTYVGKSAGRNATGNGNAFVGVNAGSNAGAGENSVFIGNLAGFNATDATSSTFIGNSAGANATGNGNAFVGANAGNNAGAAINSVYIGNTTGFNATGSGNIFIGALSGADNANGNHNVFLGNHSGRTSNGSNQLYIENTSADSLNALIYGQFNTDYLRLNAEVRIKNRLHAAKGGFFGSDGNALPASYGPGIRLFYDNVTDYSQIFSYDYAAGASKDLIIQSVGGQVAIGGVKRAAGYKLSVLGKIACEEVLVELNADWPDYVFAPTYQLPTLTEVKNHIDEKGHLIGVPSAQEVEENGIQLGEMNKILLEKIEELTLYIIEEAKHRDALDRRIKSLEMAINKMTGSH